MTLSEKVVGDFAPDDAILPLTLFVAVFFTALAALVFAHLETTLLFEIAHKISKNWKGRKIRHSQKLTSLIFGLLKKKGCDQKCVESWGLFEPFLTFDVGGVVDSG